MDEHSLSCIGFSWTYRQRLTRVLLFCTTPCLVLHAWCQIWICIVMNLFSLQMHSHQSGLMWIYSLPESTVPNYEQFTVPIKVLSFEQDKYYVLLFNTFHLFNQYWVWRYCIFRFWILLWISVNFTYSNLLIKETKRQIVSFMHILFLYPLLLILWYNKESQPFSLV